MALKELVTNTNKLLYYKWRIQNPSDVTLIYNLTSDVCLGYHQHLKTLVALKKFKIPNETADAENEILIHQSLLNRRIANDPIGSIHLQQLVAIDTTTESGYLKLIFMFVPHRFCDMFGHRTFTPSSFVEKRCYELVKIIQHLHRHHVCHCDVKPENIAVDNNGQLVLLDFGLACESAVSSCIPVCTFQYRAPELIDIELEYLKTEGLKSYQTNDKDAVVQHVGKKVYNCEAIDWWAAGCVMIEMLRSDGKPLFDPCVAITGTIEALTHLRNEVASTLNLIQHHKFDELDIFVSVATQNLLVGLLHPCPETRIQVGQGVLFS